MDLMIDRDIYPDNVYGGLNDKINNSSTVYFIIFLIAAIYFYRKNKNDIVNENIKVNNLLLNNIKN